MKIGVHAIPVYELTLSYNDVQPLLVLCNYHYDGECRRAGKEGGFIFGWRNMTQGLEREVLDTNCPVECPATRRQLDTLLKCCEGVTAAFCSKLLDVEQTQRVDRLCALVLSALEFSTRAYSKFEPHVISEPTRRGQLLWSTSPGRW